MHPGLPADWGARARAALERHAPTPEALAAAVGLEAATVAEVLPRVLDKLAREPVEDLRLDFEDGYGHRPDDVEDAVALATEGGARCLGRDDLGRLAPATGPTWPSGPATTWPTCSTRWPGWCWGGATRPPRAGRRRVRGPRRYPARRRHRRAAPGARPSGPPALAPGGEVTALTRLRWFNELSEEAAAGELLAVCHSRRWAERVAAGRPYGSLPDLQEAADAAWTALGPEDWLEAIAAHPRIGEGGGRSADWSRQEQAGVGGADRDLKERLARGNAEYEARFGHVFLVSAAGRDAGEILDALQVRLGNDPDTELRVAAEEHRRITRLRIEKLMGG
jgi:2-oxo-4-hydroxy-4-carboxy-5-ureidoimidazoline decarboxylase